MEKKANHIYWCGQEITDGKKLGNLCQFEDALESAGFELENVYSKKYPTCVYKRYVLNELQD